MTTIYIDMTSIYIEITSPSDKTASLYGAKGFMVVAVTSISKEMAALPSKRNIPWTRLF